MNKNIVCSIFDKMSISQKVSYLERIHRNALEEATKRSDTLDKRLEDILKKQ